MEWIKIDEQLPSRPETPYKTYFVWLRGINGKEEHGIASTLQFSRDRNAFMPPPGNLIITHWAMIERPNFDD